MEAKIAVCIFFLLTVAGLGRCHLKDQCQMYYGGLVFPEGSPRTVEHGMHWSKTRSESLKCIFFMAT